MPIIYSKISSEPAAEPVTLAEAKTHLRVDNDDENSLITILIQAAMELVEQRTGRSLITQTRVAKLDYFPCGDTILLPNGPVASVTSITYYDEDEVSQPLDSSLYWVDTSSDIARVVIKESWPSTYSMPNAVTVTYVCGYGASSSYVPKPLKQAMYLILGHLYENRQQVIVGTGGISVAEIPYGADVLMSSYVLEQSVYY